MCYRENSTTKERTIAEGKHWIFNTARKSCTLRRFTAGPLKVCTSLVKMYLYTFLGTDFLIPESILKKKKHETVNICMRWKS